MSGPLYSAPAADDPETNATTSRATLITSAHELAGGPGGLGTTWGFLSDGAPRPPRQNRGALDDLITLEVVDLGVAEPERRIDVAIVGAERRSRPADRGRRVGAAARRRRPAHGGEIGRAVSHDRRTRARV